VWAGHVSLRETGKQRLPPVTVRVAGGKASVLAVVVVPEFLMQRPHRGKGLQELRHARLPAIGRDPVPDVAHQFVVGLALAVLAHQFDVGNELVAMCGGDAAERHDHQFAAMGVLQPFAALAEFRDTGDVACLDRPDPPGPVEHIRHDDGDRDLRRSHFPLRH
jgi:hypothetical protein